MALKESNMMALGTEAPDFKLPDPATGKDFALDDVRGPKGTVVMFICNHCPYVIHVNPELVKVANDYQERGIHFVAISSNDVAKYPADGPEEMAEVSRQLSYPFPYLYDEDQSVARAYDAACTPDLYLFDENLQLYYRGRLDASRPGNNAALTGEDLRRAMDMLLTRMPAPPEQRPSAGCSIKWK